MLPATLESRANQIFEEMGGLSAARSYFREEDITDICLFNGFTEILFPFYKPFEGTLDNGLYDYKSIDLTLINYKPGTHICITDKYYRPLYNTQISPEIIDGKASYYFGRSIADRDFLATCQDGQLLLMLYTTDTSPNLAQIVVSHKLPVSVVNLNRNLWNSGLKAVGSELASYGEIIISNKQNIEVMAFRVDGTLKEGLTEQDIVYGDNTSVYTLPTADIYMKFDRDTWLCLREYISYDEEGIYSINDQEELKELLELRGYSLAHNTKQGYIMTKQDSSYTLEVIVTVEENNVVDTVTSSKFKRLTLEAITGSNINLIQTIDDVFHLSVKSNHIHSNINTESKLMSKSVFKAGANLIYV